MTNQPPPGWFPDPDGSGWRYWDGAQWTARSPAPPDVAAAQMQKPRGMSGRALLIFLLFILAVLVGRQLIDRPNGTDASSSDSTQQASTTTSVARPSESSTTTSVARPSDDSIATAARQYVLDSLGLASNFTDWVCPTADVGTSQCWPPYVREFTYQSGHLRVVMQVDGQSAEGTDLGNSAAHAVTNFIRLGKPPAIVTENVDWVVAVDMTDAHLWTYPV